jgi:hypothetical protein
MANLCNSLIATDIQADCDNLGIKGLEPDGKIINRADIDFANCVMDNGNPANPNIIKTIVLKSGKSAYDVAQMGNTPFTGLVSNLNVGAYINTWTTDIPIAILANDPVVAHEVIDALANGEFVLILKNKNRGTAGNAKYQVFGYAQGCRASAGTRDAYSEDVEGGWLVTLQEANHPKSAMFLYDTDEATTDAAYEAL